MANNCFYDLKAVGTKKSVKELVRILQYKHPKLCLYRIFSAEVCDEGVTPHGKYYVIICGDVAWSIYSSMLHEPMPGPKGWSDILTETDRLNLTVEIFSSEPGIGFQEHYIINKGEIKVDECPDYSEIWYDSSDWEGNTEKAKFAAFCKGYGLRNVSLKDLEDGCIYKVGGLPNYGEWSI